MSRIHDLINEILVLDNIRKKKHDNTPYIIKESMKLSLKQNPQQAIETLRAAYRINDQMDKNNCIFRCKVCHKTFNVKHSLTQHIYDSNHTRNN